MADTSETYTRQSNPLKTEIRELFCETVQIRDPDTKVEGHQSGHRGMSATKSGVPPRENPPILDPTL